MRLVRFAFVLLLAVASFAQTNAPVAFTDVSVIPMDTERVMPHQVVLVDGDKIVQVGDVGKVGLPAGAQIIDGRGKFLMPGLADMHTHVTTKELLPLLLRSGVTTILNMGLATPDFVTQVRFDIARGSEPGPQAFAAFMIDGPGDPGPEFVPACELDARQAVDRAKLLGYDFIKVYGRLQPDMYVVVLDEAAKQHMAVVGHIPKAVGLEKALDSGQVMIAHAEEYYKTYFDNKPDDSRIAPAVELTKKAGAYVTPNLSFFAALTARTSHPENLDRILDSSDNRFLPPPLRASWAASRPATASDRLVPELNTLRKLTLAMSKAGIPLLAGTDTPASTMLPGTSLHEDLRQLVAAGLTPFQALSAATRVPGDFIARFVPGAERFGVVQSGARADLILLASNPLQDLGNADHLVGVMIAGKWWPEGKLNALAEAPVPQYERIKARERSFRSTTKSSSAAAAIRSEQKLGHVPPLPEAFLNTFGYELLRDKKVGDAVAVFTLATSLYADSWNAYDSLGDGYMAAGDHARALVCYRHSVALNGRNYGAVENIRRLLEK